MVSKVARAVHFAHQRGVLHRDLKPANILLTPDGVAKVADFGIVKATMRATQTEAGIIKGKFYYMSPEQINDQKYNEKSDIWSLGCILYELCALKHPFEAKN